MGGSTDGAEIFRAGGQVSAHIEVEHDRFIQRNQYGTDLFFGAAERLEVGLKSGRMELEKILMSPDPMEYERRPLAVSPSYEQCVAAPTGPRADYVVTPLAMAALLTWEEEDDGE
jgi:hypothetical protein